MNLRMLFFMSVFCVGAVSVGAAEMQASSNSVTSTTTTLRTTNTTTIQASTVYPEGRYMVGVVPSFNAQREDRIEKVMGAVPGLSNVKAKSDDSTLHFTVKEGVPVRFSDLQKAITKVDPQAAITVPVLENSLTPNPGL